VGYALRLLAIAGFSVLVKWGGFTFKEPLIQPLLGWFSMLFIAVREISVCQKTFSSLGFDVHARQTRRYRFLNEMDLIVPWRKLCWLIEPHFSKGEGGRLPIGIDRTLRIYFLQVFYNLSDPAVEDVL
jgi:hypothetical protein